MGWSEQHRRIVRAVAGLAITTAGLWCGNQAIAEMAVLPRVASGLEEPAFVTQMPTDANQLLVETKTTNPAGGPVADANMANENSAVPEPSSVFLGACFVGLFILVTFLRWKFDRSAIRN